MNIPPPTCSNCMKQCPGDGPCDHHVYSPDTLPMQVTKCDVVGCRIQYEGKWWNGYYDYRSHDVYIVNRAREIFG